MSSWWARRDERTDPAGLSRRGYVYQASVERSIGNGASASALLVTGSAGAVVYLREVSSTADQVRASLWEISAASGASGSARGQNLNRTITGSGSVSALVLSASLTSATATDVLASDIVPTGGNKGGGIASCSKVRTLATSASYVLRWENLGNNATIVNTTLVWSEGEPAPYTTVQ